MDKDAAFHARAGGDGDDDGEQGRGASEHGSREEREGDGFGGQRGGYLCGRGSRLGREKVTSL